MTMRQRPHVLMNMATTVDGKITSALREHPSFTSTRDKRTMDRIRATVDAVLIGAGTLRADDPPLGVRDPEALAHRRSLGKPDDVIEVVVSHDLVLPTSSRFLRTRPVRRILAVPVRADGDESTVRKAGVELWRLGASDVDLPALLDRLAHEGVERLLIEGGGELNWSFVSRGLVDELFVTLAPVLLGGRSAPTLLEGDGFAMAEQQRLALLRADIHEGEIYCHYRIDRPAPAGQP